MNMPEGAGDEDSKSIKNYSVNTLHENETSYIIYGAKDAGKTILLNKLFLQQLCNPSRTKIPVLLKFHEISSKDIKKEIRDYLTVSMSYLDQLLASNRIVLYIDDLQFDKQFETLESLIKIKIQYPHIKIIATCLQDMESTFPINYLEYNANFAFDIVFIHSFGSKQIKALVKKYFTFKKIDFQENIESLIKYFLELSLPRNPLIVTIFLWIFEKQENRPINISTLVELFIENLLEKANLENVYRQTFNYGNKVRLLAHLAKFFDEKGDPSRSYECTYEDVLKYTRDYLKNKFDGDPQAILDNLIKRGIFIKHNGCIRFKVAFIFHYFVATYMTIDTEFKAYVLKEENYLKYSEEIQFYSSIKMDSTDVLEFVVEKAHEAFKETNDYQLNTYKRVDEVLNSSNIVSQDVDLTKISSVSKEDKIEETSDLRIDSLPVNKDIADKRKVSSKQLSTILKLAANVLRNSEEIDDYDKKQMAYDIIIKSSVSFMLLYRDAIITYYEEHKESPSFLPKNMDITFFINTLPLTHQVIMYNWIGTVKLLPLLRDKMAKDQLSLNITEYEKLLSVFIYTDLRGKEYYEIFKKFVETKRPNYILDLSLLKLISYYFLRVKDAKTETMVLSLMADLKQRLGQVKKEGKSAFIQNLKKKKHIRVNKNIKSKSK